MLPLLFAAILFLSGAREQRLDEASRSYKQHKDYASLELLCRRYLKTELSRAAVESLLGKADYSPIDGQEYYLANKKSSSGRGTMGLVVDYRDEQGKLTAKLHDFWLGEIGE